MTTPASQDDRPVYDAYVAGRLSAGLAAGVRAGLFDPLAAEPRTAEALAEATSTHPRGLRAWLTAMRAGGLVERDAAGRWSLPAAVAASAVRGREGSLAGLIDLEVDEFLSPERVLEGLRTGGPCVYDASDPWAEHAADPAKARAFTEAMHAISVRPAAAMAAVAPLEDARSLLDPGGGSGALSLALATRFEQLSCTILEIPAVVPLANEFAADAGLGERVRAVEGSLFADAWPGPHDAVLLSQILHDWSDEEAVRLVARARGALAPGGRLLIHEKLVDDDGEGPLANALVNLDMLVWTEGRQWTPRDLTELLEAGGFGQVEVVPTFGYWSLVSAVRVD